MPVITIEMSSQEYDKKAEIASVFTEELSRITGIRKEAIVVLFHELSAQQVASGGVMLEEKLK